MKQMKRMLFFCVSLLLVIGLIAGCSSNEGTKDNVNSKNVSVTKDHVFPVTVKDGVGKEITINQEPQKIVSLIPSNTEIAYELGLEDKLVGVSDWDNYPESVKTKEKIGGDTFNVEKIISLKPDLVLAHASQVTKSEQGFKQLESAGIKVFLVNDSNSFASVYQSIIQIGNVTGTAKKAENLVNTMKEKIEKIRAEGKTIKEKDKKKVWIEISPAPQLYSAGSGTFMNEMLEIIGAKNVAGNLEGWPQFSEEDAVLLNPDVIITTYGGFVDKPVEQVLNRKAWGNVPAIKNKHVYDVNSDIVTRAGPRLVEGVEELAKTVYPSIYK